MCHPFANTVPPLKCHFPTSHTYMPDFTFLYGGIVGQDLGNTSSEDKDVLPAVEVSEYSKHLKTFEGKNGRKARISRHFAGMRQKYMKLSKLAVTGN